MTQFGILPGITWANRIRLAQSGDKATARRLLEEIAQRLRSGEDIPPEGIDYLATALEQIAGGERADKALNTSGRPGAPDRRKRKFGAVVGAVIARELIESGLSEFEAYSDACVEVDALGFETSESAIRRAYKENA